MAKKVDAYMQEYVYSVLYTVYSTVVVGLISALEFFNWSSVSLYTKSL